MRISSPPQSAASGASSEGKALKNVLILGVNGFIGHHLTRRILSTTDWNVYGMDMYADRIEEFVRDKRFHFFEGDILINREWIEYHVKKCDVVLPLVAIATPAAYVKRPLEVFELDFEANLPIVRACVKRGKRLIFPSTSEVYGMCPDEEFDSETSNLVLGPISKQRWIYSCSKQLLDRVIWAYGSSGDLDFTLFRPFNWIGPGLDKLHAAKEGSSRVATQFLGHIARGEDIRLVDGGAQRRSFTDVEDAILALMTIIDNPGQIARGKIYNIGNPDNNLSIRELAELMLKLAKEFPEWSERADRVKIIDISADAYYGAGYQDMLNRRPQIAATSRELDWHPTIRMEQTLRGLFRFYADQLPNARGLIDDATGAGGRA
jgi:nucleoside-diphosphate-sugar epimerase